MAQTRYRVILKVLCDSCIRAKASGHIVKDCTSCRFIKYNNVTRLCKFTDFIDSHFPNWVWFKVYRYVSGRAGEELKMFRNWHKTYTRDGDRWIPTGTTREVPDRDQL